MSKVIGILALLGGGQPGIYSTLYNGGSQYQQAQNCLRGIVVPYTAFTTASTSQFTVRVCGVTLQ